MDFIKECYRITFAEVVSKATTLWFANLEWEDSEADVLIELAPFCDDLQLLIVSRNHFSGEACMRLIKAFAPISSLKIIDIVDNPVTFEELSEIQKAWDQ